MTVRGESPQEVAFPNVDLTAHLIGEPVGEWLGFDTTVSFGARRPRGHRRRGCTTLRGPVGVLAQALTVRPVARPEASPGG